MPGDWDLDVAPVEEISKVKACRDHFERGLSREETGIIDHLLGHIRTRGTIDGRTSSPEFFARHERVDRLFAAALGTVGFV